MSTLNIEIYLIILSKDQISMIRSSVSLAKIIANMALNFFRKLLTIKMIGAIVDTMGHAMTLGIYLNRLICISK